MNEDTPVRGQVDVDLIPRPVAAFRSLPADSWREPERHAHRKAQLLYTVRGIISIEVEDGMWIVPPQCAVWIPPDLVHTATSSASSTEGYCLFVAVDAAPDLPKSCCTLAVSPLLRELLLAAVGLDQLYALNGREGRLIATLLDELAAAPVEDMHLPMPRDPRLRTMTAAMIADPAAKVTLDRWAARIGMSRRSVTRAFTDETGLSLGRWRRQLHIVVALQRMSEGQSVQRVAHDLGYENASGFVTMFRKVIGRPPASYLAKRNRGAPPAE